MSLAPTPLRSKVMIGDVDSGGVTQVKPKADLSEHRLPVRLDVGHSDFLYIG